MSGWLEFCKNQCRALGKEQTNKDLSTQNGVHEQMPTYRYRCADCGNEFDQYQKFSEDPLTECPSCAGRIRRVIQPVGVVFKGSGWYVTDSRPSSKGSGSDGKADSSEKTDSVEKPESAAASKDGKDAALAKTPDASKPAKSAEPAKSKDSKVASGT
jgi:putative FmdB family regulatory protein